MCTLTGSVAVAPCSLLATRRRHLGEILGGRSGESIDEGTGEAEGGRAAALGRGEPELSDIIDRRRDGEGKAPGNEKMKHQKTSS